MKFILFICILSLLSAVVAGTPDENINESKFNISIIVKNIEGHPIENASVEAIYPQGNIVIKNTDSNGNADLVITENSKINVRAFGYWNWASDGQIRPSSIILTLENQYNDTNFHIVNSKGEDVPHAFVIIIDSMGNEFVKQTDTMGIASTQIIPGRTNITIKAEGYKNFNTELIVSENSNSKFYLDFIVSSKIILWNFILLILPFLSMLIIIVSNRHKYWYLPAFFWIIAFGAFSYLTVYYTNNFLIYFFDPVLKVPLFVPIIAFIGAISYITISDLKYREQKLGVDELERIRCAYGRRLLMSPYIAIIALFTLSEVAGMKNPWTIVFFAYFVGLYTKAIEGTLMELGMKFLTTKQKKELIIRDLAKSNVSKRLGTSDRIGKNLDKANINTISDLISIPDEKIGEYAEKTELDESYLKSLKEDAKKYIQ